MSYDFRSAAELLEICAEYELPISEVMILRETEFAMLSRESVIDEIDRRLRIMHVSVSKAVTEPKESMGGLLGGQAKKLRDLDESKLLCGHVIHNALVGALAVAETNASMGVIVASPTAGSAGVLPAVLLAAFEGMDLDPDKLRAGLACAGAIGYLMTRNGSVAGAEAGCQAEVGSASAMAAAALVEMLGGSPQQCMDAAVLAISNLLGLVCDPVGGLVEVPCQTRNTIGASGAFTAAELALAGISLGISLDEMIKVMLKVGRTIPEDLRETARGGCATAVMCRGCK